MVEPLLQLDGVTVSYGGVRALDGITLALAPGEIAALIGANGAGKTTLLKSVIGLVRAPGIRFGGDLLDPLPPDRRARLGIGYVPEGRRVFAGMSAEENLLVASREGATGRSVRAAAMFDLFPALAERRAAVERNRRLVEEYGLLETNMAKMEAWYYRLAGRPGEAGIHES